MSGYEVKREQLKRHAKELDLIANAWEASVCNLINGPEVSLDGASLTGSGDYVGETYRSITGSYAGQAAEVLRVLRQAASVMRFTEKTYGEAESTVQEGLRKLEAQPAPHTPPQSGLGWLRP